MMANQYMVRNEHVTQNQTKVLTESNALVVNNNNELIIEEYDTRHTIKCNKAWIIVTNEVINKYKYNSPKTLNIKAAINKLIIPTHIIHGERVNRLITELNDSIKKNMKTSYDLGGSKMTDPEEIQEKHKTIKKQNKLATKNKVDKIELENQLFIVLVIRLIESFISARANKTNVIFINVESNFFNNYKNVTPLPVFYQKKKYNILLEFIKELNNQYGINFVIRDQSDLFLPIADIAIKRTEEKVVKIFDDKSRVITTPEYELAKYIYKIKNQDGEKINITKLEENTSIINKNNKKFDIYVTKF